MKIEHKWSQGYDRVPRTVYCTNCGGQQESFGHIEDLRSFVRNCNLCEGTRIQPIPWSEL